MHSSIVVDALGGIEAEVPYAIAMKKMNSIATQLTYNQAYKR